MTVTRVDCARGTAIVAGVTSRFSRVLRGAGVAALGVSLGLGSSVAAGVAAFRAGGVAVGAWRTNVNIGSAAASPWLRAAIALGGLLALDRRETLYFTASDDDAGRGLSRRCAYRVEGAQPDARWWSVTVYGADGFLIPNRARRYSFGSGAVARGEDVRFELAPRADDPAVVPLGDAPTDGGFNLTLRLYEPSAETARDPSRARLPHITRLRCR